MRELTTSDLLCSGWHADSEARRQVMGGGDSLASQSCPAKGLTPQGSDGMTPTGLSAVSLAFDGKHGLEDPTAAGEQHSVSPTGVDPGPLPVVPRRHGRAPPETLGETSPESWKSWWGEGSSQRIHLRSPQEGALGLDCPESAAGQGGLLV